MTKIPLSSRRHGLAIGVVGYILFYFLLVREGWKNSILSVEAVSLCRKGYEIH